MLIPVADRGLLFDLDDTLVQTGVIVKQSMQVWCELHEFDPDVVLAHSAGRRTADTVALVAPHLDPIVEALRIEQIEDSLLDQLQPVAGAVELLSGIAGLSWGIVTSSGATLARSKIKVARLTLPQCLVTAESVSAGKPSPEGYLRAAQELGISPARCIVFEDADAGVEAGLAAGCSVIGVGSNLSKINGLLAIIPDFRQVVLNGNELRVAE